MTAATAGYYLSMYLHCEVNYSDFAKCHIGRVGLIKTQNIFNTRRLSFLIITSLLQINSNCMLEWDIGFESLIYFILCLSENICSANSDISGSLTFRLVERPLEKALYRFPRQWLNLFLLLLWGQQTGVFFPVIL